MPLFSRIILRDLSKPIRQRHNKYTGPYTLDFSRVDVADRRGPRHLFYYASDEAGGMGSHDSLGIRLRTSLANDFLPNRWGSLGRITGYYYDDFQGETLIPIVARLNHSSGEQDNDEGRFLAGYTMGKGMASTLDYSTVWDNAHDAAMEAHRFAEHAAEEERIYQEEESERLQQEETDAMLEEGKSVN